jgi:hypothetical protein
MLCGRRQAIIYRRTGELVPSVIFTVNGKELLRESVFLGLFKLIERRFEIDGVPCEFIWRVVAGIPNGKVFVGGAVVMEIDALHG